MGARNGLSVSIIILLFGIKEKVFLRSEEFLKVSYQGIRPAPGYPACPDHTQKITLFELLDVQQEIGVELTEGMAMMPAASVSGWYFAHPESRYFGVGKIRPDQVESVAERRGWSVEETTRWLSANLEL